MSPIPDCGVSPFQLDGATKAALVLLALGPDTAAVVLRSLTETEIKLISTRLIAVRQLDLTQWIEVLRAFREASNDQRLLGIDTDQFMDRALQHTDVDERSLGFRNRSFALIDQSALAAIEAFDSDLLHARISDEHPQIIASLLALMDAQASAALAACFGDELRNELLLRVALLDHVHPMAMEDLNEALRAIALDPIDKRSRLGGTKHTAALINAFDKPLDQDALDRMRAFEPELADRVEAQRFLFEDFLSIPKRSLQTLVMNIGPEELASAMQSCSDALRQCLLAAMPAPLAEAVRDTLKIVKQNNANNSRAAQQRMLARARSLHQEGLIQLKVIPANLEEDV
ncbi:MAG: FliG C-terminal domain-containing protein [Betaproteobacteria bacterium]